VLRKRFGGFVASLLTNVWNIDDLASDPRVPLFGRSDLMDYIVTANISLLSLRYYFVAVDQRQRAYVFASRRCPQMLDV
jgi:hypothetical protein